jgi:hypothetical protein
LPALRPPPPAGRRRRLAPRTGAADSAAIDTPLHHRKKDRTMKPTIARRLLSVASAAFVTIVMLTGVNLLATAEPTAAQWAQQVAPAAKA